MNRIITLRSLLRFGCTTATFCFLALPSGGFEIIRFIALLFICVVFILLITNRVVVAAYFQLFVVLSVLVVIAFSIVVAIRNATFSSYTITAARNFVIVIFIVYVGMNMLKSDVFSFAEEASVFVYSLVFYSTIKLSLLLFTLVNPVVSFKIIESFLPNSIIYSSVGIEGFFRFVSVNDFFFPFLYFSIDIVTPKIGRRVLLKVLFLGNILISMSRYLWIAFAILLLIDSVLRKKIRRIIIAPLVFCLVLIIVNEYTNFKIINSIVNRTSKEGVSSLLEKRKQTDILFNEFLEYPLSGKGIGSYVEEYTRNARFKYVYEVFLVALLMQLGLVKYLILFLISSIPFLIPKKKYKMSKKGIFLFFSFFVYLLSGFTNPVLLSSMSGFMFLLHYSQLNQFRHQDR